METQSAIRSSAKRGVGRPRRLTLDAIIDAACDIGLNNLDMALVAERLNTGVATLYGYVKSREQLEQLVFQRLATGARVGEDAASWQDVLREHASVSFHTTESSPHILAYLVNGEPTERENAYAAEIIRKLSNHGLPTEHAVMLYIEVTQLVIGAAVCLARAKRMVERNPACALFVADSLGDYRPTMERIFRDYELSSFPSGAGGRS